MAQKTKSMGARPGADAVGARVTLGAEAVGARVTLGPPVDEDRSLRGRHSRGAQLLALEVIDRQEIVDDYAAGMYQPRLPSGVQARFRKIVVSYTWLIVQIVAVTIDLVFVFFEPEDPTMMWQLTIFTSILYTIDIFMRVLAMGACEFLTKWGNRMDIIIIYVATVGAILQTSASRIRVLRVARIAIVLNRKLRHITGQNKQRYLSVENDLDIDLAYVTPRLIAMSVPAEDYITRLYRNDIKDVVRFFHLFHRAHFHICNLCPELPYNPARFGCNPRTLRPNVDHFNVQDHTPPLMDDFLRFFKIARGWMSEDDDNILAIHCRGGKGRTGSLCCAWLLYNDDAKHAQDAMNLFALARTDIDKVGRIRQMKLQGVETPSQVRYVRYIDTLLRGGPYRFPDPVLPPKISRLRLHRLVIEDMFTNDKKPKKLVAAVHVPFSDPHETHTEFQASWKIIYWTPEVWASNHVELDLGNLVISKDTRITVFKADKKEEVQSHEGQHILAGTEPGCLFYFLFHTYFHREDNTVVLPKSELDKAWKSSKYKEEGAVTLHFERAPHLQSAVKKVAQNQRIARSFQSGRDSIQIPAQPSAAPALASQPSQPAELPASVP